MASKFLTEPDDSLKCLICMEVASDPKQHGECGKLFCSECLEKNENKPCPNCRAENPQYFPDGKSQREIKALCVRCNDVDQGCDWERTVMSLNGHMTKCGFALVSCPNKCKIEGNDLKLMKKDLDDHLKTICRNRDYECVCCGEKGTYASMTEVHDSVCIKKVVLCPNTECTSTMERGLTEEHVQTVCNYTEVACNYASIGCSVKKMRLDMKQHKEDDKSHFSMVLEKIMKLENTTSSLEYTTSMLKKNLDTLKKNKLITFSLSGYSSKKEDDVIFYSEPFYTSPGGYKMCIEVDPNGCGAGEGTHVSVYSSILKGPNDNDLPWPFLGNVTFSLLNQLVDDNHHSMQLSITTVINARVDNLSHGYPLFFPHTELSHDQASNTQYLMEDTLYFRVTVEVDHHKPWLHCTAHFPLQYNLLY